MKMSTKGRYGLRMMVELASRFGQGPVLVDAIAKSQNISGKYIHNLFVHLKTAGLIRAIRGPSGGYELARSPSEITAGDVVRALEGSPSLVECVHNLAHCPRTNICVAREVWQEVALSVEKVLSQITLEQLAARQKAKLEKFQMFHI